MYHNAIFHPNELLEIWERGFTKTSQQRADDLISIYRTAVHGKEQETKKLSIEKKEQYLLEIRRLLFGRKFLSVAACPSCNVMAEWEMNYVDFSNNLMKDDIDEKYVLKDGEYTVQYRLPNETDLDLEERIQILKNCIVGIRKGREDVIVQELPSKLWNTLEHEIEIKSPLSSSTIHLSCPDCKHEWNLYFSIFEFLWTELDQWAGRFLITISSLARYYGWSESEIVNLHPIRRAYYLSSFEHLMSYIDHLIQRQKGHLPLVRPRTPSLFETYTTNAASQNSIGSQSRTDLVQDASPQKDMRSVNRATTQSQDKLEVTDHKNSVTNPDQPALDFNRSKQKNNFAPRKTQSENPQVGYVNSNKTSADGRSDPKLEGQLFDEVLNNQLVSKFHFNYSFPGQVDQARIIHKANDLWRPRNKQTSSSKEERSIKVTIGTVEVRAITEKKPTPVKKKV